MMNKKIDFKGRIINRTATILEAMKLMDFNPDFIEKTINSKEISDSQLYRQAGNSIVVNCLVEIIKKLNV